jgi:hypothetical protein
MPSKKAQERRTQWRRLYQEYVESGLNAKEFSRERRVLYWSLKAWVKRFEAEGSKFVEIGAPLVSPEYTLVLRNGRELRISGLFSERRLRQLIGVVEEC